MKKLLFFVLSVFVFINLFSQTLSTPIIWLKPTMQGDSAFLLNVETIPIAQSLNSLKLPKSYINNNPSVHVLDSLNIYKMPYDSLSKGKQATIFTAYYTVSLNKIGLWEISKDSNRLIWLNSQEISYKNTKITYRDSTEPGPIVNISHYNLPKRDSILSNEDTLFIGKEGDHYFSGDFGEYLYFTGALNQEDERKWETYLAIKYGATLKNQYVNSQGDTLWSTKEDSLYSQGIAGIGRDDLTTLYQRKSHIYQDNISLNLTDSISQDNTYIIWGHNGLEAIPSIPYPIDTLQYLQMTRQWKVQPYKYNTQAQQLNTEIIYNYPYNVSPGGVILIINRNSDTDLNPYTSDRYYPDSIGGGNIYFKNILWDTDNSGQDYFTIAINTDSLNQDLPTKSETINYSDQSSTEKELTLQLQPNPSTGTFTLHISQEKDAPLNIRITDSHGKEIKKYTKEQASQETTLTDSIDNVGVYLIQVSNQEERKTIKLLIVK